MAVSFRIVVFVVALLLFGGLYITMDVPVQDPFDPVAEEQSDSDHSQSFLGLLRETWALAPFLFLFAASLWLIRESVWVGGGG